MGTTNELGSFSTQDDKKLARFNTSFFRFPVKSHSAFNLFVWSGHLSHFVSTVMVEWLPYWLNFLSSCSFVPSDATYGDRTKPRSSPQCLGGWSLLLKINDALQLIISKMETEIRAAVLWIKGLETSFTSLGFIALAFIGHGSEVTLSTHLITQPNAQTHIWILCLLLKLNWICFNYI